MSDQAAAETMQAFYGALESRGDISTYFADDVTLEVVGTPQAARGRTAVHDMIMSLHTQVFDGNVKAKTVFVADGHAAAECDFVGVHTGEFLGIAATGRTIEVPYAVVYDVADSGISALRIYMSMDLIRQQLTGAA